MTPVELLAAADRLLNQPTSTMEQSWQRACAGLTRTAVERGLDEHWRRVAPSLIGRPVRHQLIALASFAEPDVVRHACAVWNELSRAMHHHAYELPPTLAELLDWHRTAKIVLASLAHQRGAADQS